MNDIFSVIGYGRYPLLERINIYLLSLTPSTARVEGSFNIVAHMNAPNLSLNNLENRTMYKLFKYSNSTNIYNDI